MPVDNWLILALIMMVISVIFCAILPMIIRLYIARRRHRRYRLDLQELACSTPEDLFNLRSIYQNVQREDVLSPEHSILFSQIPFIDDVNREDETFIKTLMLEWNLNFLMTFFWLFLSSGLLLCGIWFLIDCSISRSTMNSILHYFNFYGKSTNNGRISKTSFRHFYLLGLLINLVLFVFHLSFFLLFLIFLLHLIRRLYECLYIHRFTGQINFFYYIFGLIHYPCVGLTIIIDYQYSYATMTFWKYFFALILFVNASYMQYHIHLALANLTRNETDIYPIPNGYWLFNYISCPNSIAEILIYLSFLIASHRTSAMTALIVWVFVNQSLSALLNHRWYCRYYKDLYPSKRCALIPFIL